jgi:hypothetical protein
MNVELGAAGLICVGLAAGHTTLGLVWVLPGLTEGRLPGTLFGPPSVSVAMVRVTWYIAALFALALSGVLMTLALADDADSERVFLRWFAAMWLAATAMWFWVNGRLGNLRGLRALLRLYVPLLWLAVAVLCWTAST